MNYDVDICTEESQLSITYGPDWFGEEPSSELALGSVKYICTDLSDIKKSFFRLGFHLHEFSALRYYEQFGYDNLADFCKANFGLESSAVSRCINVFLMTCRRTEFDLPQVYMDDRYKAYSYSQLCEMLSIPEDKRRGVMSSMTVKEIREYKKSLKTKKDDLGSAIDTLQKTMNGIATSQKSKHFDYDKCIGLKGAALCSFIKSVVGIDMIGLHIYDSSGKKILDLSNEWVDVLEWSKKDMRLVLRLTHPFPRKD